MAATVSATFLSGAKLVANKEKIAPSARRQHLVKCQGKDGVQQPVGLSRREILSAVGLAAASVALPAAANSLTESELRRQEWSARINGAKGGIKVPALSPEYTAPPKDEVEEDLPVKFEEPQTITLPALGNSARSSSSTAVPELAGIKSEAPAPAPRAPPPPPSLPPNLTVSPVEFRNSEGVSPGVWAGIAFAGLTSLIVFGNRPEDLPPQPPAEDAPASAEDK
eukprot:jgi/Mesvir1/16547/Mv10088-RA.1